MEWFEEPNLARSLYEILQTEQNLELLKQQLSLKTDFNMHDCWAIFDLGANGTLSRLQFEEVYLLFKIYPKREEFSLTFKHYDKDKD